MPDTTPIVPPPLPKSQPSFGKRYRTIIKLIGVGVLILLLLIPLGMITGVLSERLNRRNEAVADITSSWGKEQCVIGPVLIIPYRYRFKAVKEVSGSDGKIEKREIEETALAYAYFLPELLNVTGDAETQTLKRGIYEAAVFRAQIKLSGRFAVPDFSAFNIDLKDVQWKDALVTIAVNDLRGTREGLVLDWGGTKRPLLPSSLVPGYTTGATASLADPKPIAAPVEFSIPIDFNGSEGIYFAPFGVQNEATLKSNWPDPAFRGAFLPTERSVRDNGFDAKWKVSYYGRSYPQSWTSQMGNDRFTTQAVSQSVFGAQFLSILDSYRFVERSIKYGVLFLVLVFTTFFLFEVTARQKIHPLQYLMVGAALCLFYLLLLSISEFLGFGLAYLIAAGASTILITWYCRSFLGGGVRTLIIGAGLAGVYTFLYITLRQQDYALLMGAIALFILLAVVMYVTRKIDWYARDGGA
ncbi:MAG TPA: cell envelope integrity protein CreD [Chthoniobacterales bacterium]|jgi:inner membrane protein|nr:cell envelope integrity protein CreD [Chthoniobacterales bacterium]